MFKKLKRGQIYYLVCLYIAFVINFCLNRIKSSNTIILDGPITKNITIMKILSSLRQKQLVLKNKKEIRGKLSYQIIFFLHFGQKDRPLIICLFFGKR